MLDTYGNSESTVCDALIIYMYVGCHLCQSHCCIYIEEFQQCIMSPCKLLILCRTTKSNAVCISQNETQLFKGKKNQRKCTNSEQNQVKIGHGEKIRHILPSYPSKHNFRPGRKHKPKKEKVKTVKSVFYYIILLYYGSFHL